MEDEKQFKISRIEYRINIIFGVSCVIGAVLFAYATYISGQDFVFLALIYGFWGVYTIVMSRKPVPEKEAELEQKGSPRTRDVVIGAILTAYCIFQCVFIMGNVFAEQRAKSAVPSILEDSVNPVAEEYGADDADVIVMSNPYDGGFYYLANFGGGTQIDMGTSRFGWEYTTEFDQFFGGNDEDNDLSAVIGKISDKEGRTSEERIRGILDEEDGAQIVCSGTSDANGMTYYAYTTEDEPDMMNIAADMGLGEHSYLSLILRFYVDEDGEAKDRNAEAVCAYYGLQYK